MRPHLPQARTVAVTVTAVVGLLIATGVTGSALSDEKPDVYVYFLDASPLIAGNDVKASGVKVGTIDSIEVKDGQARLGLVLDDAVLPLHQDATARVRPVGLLGERYVELVRGSASAPTLQEGGSVPATQTSRSTDLDEVLNTVDQPTGASLSLLLTTLGEGLRGRGEDADAAVKALAPALQDTDRLAQILDDQNSVLTRLLDSVEPVATELAADRGRRLDGLVEAADTALAATADNESALDATLTRLPGSVSETRKTLATLTRVAGSTTPVLASLRPTTDELVALSTELTAFSEAAAPALDGLDPVLDQAEVLLTRARPVAQSLARSAPAMGRTAANGDELGSNVLDHLDDVLDFVKFWALTTNGEDGLSHYFRAHLVVTTEVVTGLLPDVPGVTPVVKPPDEKPVLPAVPDVGGVLGAVDGLLGGLGVGAGTGPLGGLLGGLTGQRRSTPSAAPAAPSGYTAAPAPAAQPAAPPHDPSATGLSAEQENNLMSYLIGGE